MRRLPRAHPRDLALLGFFFALTAGRCVCDEAPGLGRVVPEISVTPDVLDFGEVPIGATKRIAVLVTNSGQRLLEILGVDAPAPFAARLISNQAAPGGSTVIDVSFTPVNDQMQQAVLIIASNADNAKEVRITMTGIGVEGAVDVIPLEISMNDVTVGSARTAEIIVRNRGIADISGLIVPLYFARPAHFSLTGVSAFTSGPLSVAARSSVDLDLEYRPLATGGDSGIITFEYCGARCGSDLQVVASAVASVVRLDPPALDFGATGLGETKNAQINVVNDGEMDLEVQAFSVSGSAEVTAELIGETLPVRLSSKGMTTINLRYTPLAATTLVATLSVRTTDASIQEATAKISGQGEGPLFLVEPEAIDFGVQRTLQQHLRPLKLLNAGSSEVQVTSLTLAGDPTLGLADIPGLPIRLGAGESVFPNVTFTPSALIEATGTITISSDDPLSPSVQVPVRAGYAEQSCALGSSPTQVNFGIVPPGTSRSLPVRLTNEGDDPCTVLETDFRAPADPFFAATSVPALPLSLPAGQSADLLFSFSPNSPRDAKALFVMTTDDPVFPARSVNLVGTSLSYADVFVLPDRIDFGQRKTNCLPAERQLSLLNAGTASAVIDAVTLTSTSTEITVLSAATPFELPGGGELGMAVRWQPRDVGVDSAALEIQVRDRGYPIFVPIRGEGAINARRSETFTQAPVRLVDLLFVIDNSCSMLEEQAALAANFSSFIRSASIRAVDFRLGITTTSIGGGGLGNSGGLVGPVLNPGTPALEAVFSAQADVGAGGSGVEQGLEAMLLAFQLADFGVQPNASLFRPNAGKVVILVSDEEDQSPASVVVYFTELRNRSQGNFLVAVVTGGPGGCANSAGIADPAFRYEDFRRRTNGIFESICSANWGRTLTNLGNAAFGLRTVFPLVDPAVPGSVTVNINGAPVAAGWTYDPITGAVVFDLGMAPPENSVIEISYFGDC